MTVHGQDDDYEFIRTIIYKLSRISLGPQKKTMVMSRISKRMRLLGMKTAREYCEHLRRPSGREELSALVDVISTNHTYFFRESAHFDFLTRSILSVPTWGMNGRTLKIWSAACSSGEEPYSFGMLLAEHERANPGFRWSMEASDISTVILAKAKAAEFTEAGISKVPDALRKRYLERKPNDNLYHVSPSILAKIRYHHLNLFEVPAGFPRTFDLIICRNVMIYFDRNTREELVRMMTQRIVPGGYLFVGHSESLSGIKHDLKMLAPAIYQKQ